MIKINSELHILNHYHVVAQIKILIRIDVHIIISPFLTLDPENLKTFIKGSTGSNVIATFRCDTNKMSETSSLLVPIVITGTLAPT